MSQKFAIETYLSCTLSGIQAPDVHRAEWIRPLPRKTVLTISTNQSKIYMCTGQCAIKCDGVLVLTSGVSAG